MNLKSWLGEHRRFLAERARSAAGRARSAAGRARAAAERQPWLVERRRSVAAGRSWVVQHARSVAERRSWLVGALTLGTAALASLGIVAAIALQRSGDAPGDALRRAAAQPSSPRGSGDSDPRNRVPLPTSLADGPSPAEVGAATLSGAGTTTAAGAGGATAASPAGAGAFGTTTGFALPLAVDLKTTRAEKARGKRPGRSARGGATTASTLADSNDPAGTTETATTTTTPPTTTSPPPEPPPPPPDPPGPLEINGVNVVQTTPYTATISWRSSLPGRGQVVFGAGSPVVWSESDDGTEHKVTLGGLTQATEYEFRVVSWDRFERQVQSGLGKFTTPRLTSPPAAQVRSDTILLNGQPYFPKMVWERCDNMRDLLPFGIDLFMGCPADRNVAARVGLDAYTLSPAGHTVSGGAVIGRYLPDEWDTFLPNNTSVADIRRAIPPKQGNEIDFLGLTNHFYSFAAPLPQGRGMYPALMQNADVLGFNLYPLQIWCRASNFEHVYLSQRELHLLSGGKPTFQWIEANLMERPCGHEPHLLVTNETVRAETWLAIAAGADGIGYFPHDWNRSVGAEIRRTNAQITALAPALLSPEADVSSADGAVKVGARRAHGALYVVAVNATRQRVAAVEITLPGLADRPLTVYDENRTVNSSGNAFRDDFGPLEVHIYVVAPATPPAGTG